ncbi:hypothetical protein Hanom_Chr12g01075481 [Helianthus anomalus]
MHKVFFHLFIILTKNQNQKDLHLSLSHPPSLSSPFLSLSLKHPPPIPPLPPNHAKINPHNGFQ